MSGRHLRAGYAPESTKTLTRTVDRRRSRTGIVILFGRGEILSVHGQRDNKSSLSTVWQKSPNGLPNAAKPQGNAIFSNSPESPLRIRIRPHENLYRDCSEIVPRLFRDCCETNVRPLGDSIRRIRHEMLEQETRQRTRAEMPEPLLTLKEAAEYLRLTPAALYTQRHRGNKPGALGIRVGRKILYRPSDINRYLDELLAGNQVSLQR